MKTFVTTVVSSLVVALVMQGFVRAESKEKLSDSDFLVKAMVAGVGEVKISEYAAKNASDDKVKDYANHLVADHKALNNKLAEAAKRLKLALVVGQEKETREKLDKLSKLKGNDFDTEYLQQMVDDHQKAVALFEAESKNGADADLTTEAKTALPELKKHLQEARDLLAKVKK
jgi:putative membrane protein